VTLKIATWNVNSIRQRLEHLTCWLSQTACDILLVQETKCQDVHFPRTHIEDLGYNIAIYGQKTFNGVAVFSKFPIEDVVVGLPTFAEDPQARYVEVFTGGVRVASVYVPNGQSVGSDKYAYKLAFLEKLQAHLAHLRSWNENVIIGGDFNIAPTDRDVNDPAAWQGHVLCSPLERTAFQTLLSVGYGDVYRTLHPEQPGFSWWDYRSGALRKNDGVRIDHLLASTNCLGAITACDVDKGPRMNDKPSDHAPVWCTLS
jgi:exodeoxyribonuclease-3